jgi:hypothetical protein
LPQPDWQAPTKRVAVVDIEGRSLLDIKRVGAAKWIEHESTEPHCVGYAIDNQPAKVWRIRIPLVPLAARFEPISADLLAVLLDPEYLIVAHNALFDRLFAKHKLAEYGWPEVPLSRWRCSLAAATSKGLRAGLDHLAKDLGLPVQKADTTIMSRMAKPRPPRKGEDPSKVYWNEDAEHLELLCSYCIRDVEVTRELIRRVPVLSGPTREQWELDQIINDRGFYTDGSFIERADTVVTATQQEIQNEVQQITRGRITSIDQVKKILDWLAAAGCKLDNLQQETLQQALTRTDLTSDVRRIVELRLQATHSGAKKYKTLHKWRSIDGRIRGAFKFHTAQTGRWSAGGPQPQNFPREVDDIAAKVAPVMSGDAEEVRKLGPPIEVVSEIVRAVVGAAPGNRLLVIDYSAIESRTLAWIANEPSKLAMWEKFDQTQDPHDEPYFVLGKDLGFPRQLPASSARPETLPSVMAAECPPIATSPPLAILQMRRSKATNRHGVRSTQTPKLSGMALSIKPKEGEPNGPVDTGLRTLTFHKNQYGPAVTGLTLQWRDGLYLPVAGTVIDKVERAALAEHWTLTLLRQFTEQNRTVSINPNPSNYAPTHFAEAEEARAVGLTKDDFKAAIDRLLKRKVVRNKDFKKGSQTRYRLEIIEEEEERPA